MGSNRIIAESKERCGYNMFDKIKEMLYTFAYVTTSVLFATALFITIFSKDVTLSVSILWQILLTSFICVFGNLLYPNRELTGKQTCVRILLHYFYINAVVFGCAEFFNWYDVRDLKKSGFMFSIILIIFIVVSGIVWHHAKTISEIMNSRLKEYQDKRSKYMQEREEQEV